MAAREKPDEHVTSSGSAPRDSSFRPRAGDVLFQSMRSPIADLTTGAQGELGIAHCALALGPDEVLEAVWPRVRRVPLTEFLQRTLDDEGRPAVFVARVRPEFAHLVPRAVACALGWEGRPYDQAFRRGDDAYYCSELIVEAFRAANGGKPLFDELAMTFCEPGTATISPYWRDHFARLGVAVPQGEPGSNPAALARSPVLEVVHVYGSTGPRPTDERADDARRGAPARLHSRPRSHRSMG